MTSTSDDSNDANKANKANAAQNPGGDDEDLIDEKFQALVSGLSLDESTPTTYLDELDRNVDDERFTPPVPAKSNLKKFLADGVRAFKKWKDNPRSDNSDLDDDGAQV
jgi:hypothetical protein